MQNDSRLAVSTAAVALALAACSSSADDLDAAVVVPDDAAPPVDVASEPSEADAGGLAGAVSTLAGTEEPGHQDGNNSRFDNPVNVAVDPASGDVFLADRGNHAIRRVRDDGFASTVITESGGTFIEPFGLAFYDGTLYAHSDQGGTNPGLWEVDIGEGSAERILGVGQMHGLGTHPDRGLILPDRGRHVIELFDPSSLSLSPLAGGEGESGYVDGQGDEARFDEPMAAIALPGGDILVADSGNHVIRRVTLDGEVSTFAGEGEPGTVDGPVAEARFDRPVGLIRDDDGTIYVSCADGHVIRAIADGEVRTIAGSGTPGFADSEDDPLAAQFFGLGGIAAAPGSGVLYAADGDRGAGEPYHRIRRIELD